VSRLGFGFGFEFFGGQQLPSPTGQGCKTLLLHGFLLLGLDGSADADRTPCVALGDAGMKSNMRSEELFPNFRRNVREAVR
jgi:hypothetical protein